MAEKKEENIQIGIRIKQVREAAGLTQERLAELLDVTAQYISGVERGAVGLSVPKPQLHPQGIPAIKGLRLHGKREFPME